MPKKKGKRTTAKDQIGAGAAKKATQLVESGRQSRESRLNSIMEQMRKRQSTDSHQ